ncbi:MAG: TonB-dependent receptor [Pseudomonadales bacterium]|jgi:hemoglobin/transferrin/lactoferrin receptor protein|nr:TonB-dependent receptor [Pseudomonadales bacterium]MDP7146590.1 TonB-dependent receptor [Pseudomonadales bacterium]MDP7358118.1 TonB-dependent receptor [Pseudomonadales bacterium]MDP7594472.1 TonB-dependent receptor [Pseudomonadales bacterium]HJN49479.1 TonB-dependent receptor [Pseudomonadales bacterium]|tara:strand:+ start:7148 stop:8584 length:1437 start_codon:yes stop_codon:yes gene_type:complete
MENTRYDSDSIAINISRSSGNHHVELAYEDYRSAAEVYVEPEVRFTPPFLDFAIDAPKRDRRKSAIFYSMEPTNGLLGRVAANAYRQVSDRQFNTFPSMLLTVPPPGMQIDSSIYTESRLITDGALLQLDWQPSWKHYLVTGIQFNHDEVDQKRHKETRINLGAPGFEDIAEKASIATTAVFVQDDWQVADDWTLVAGLRNYWVKGSLDQTDRANLESGHLNDRHLIGSVSLLYAGLNDTVLRANVSQGYVYPSLLQLATGAYAGSRFINPSLNLTPETSDTAELGLRHQGTRWMIDATLFTSRAENYIDHLRCRSIDNCLTARDETYRNVGESKSFGVEIDLAYLPDSSAIKPYLNVGWLRQKNEVDALDSYKTGLPLWQGRFGSTFTGSYGGFELRGDLFLRVQSGSERLEMTGHGPAESSKSGWLTVNLVLGIALRDRYRLNIGLRNLTDRRYTAATENLFAEQRSIHAKVSLAL